jgi:hypothetical protein
MGQIAVRNWSRRSINPFRIGVVERGKIYNDRRQVQGQLVSPFPDTSFIGGKIASPGSFHVAAYFATLGAGAQTDTDLTALTDGILYIQNNHFLPQVDSSVLWAQANGASLTRAKFQSPKIRQLNTAYIRPINQNVSNVNNGNMMILDYGRLVVRGLEELQMLVSDSAGGVKQTTCFCLGANRVAIPNGDVLNFRATGTTAQAANAWTACPLTFEVLPPVGTYVVIGAECIAATGQAFRFTFDGQYYRPGLPAIPNVQSRLLWEDYYGCCGVWGYFRTTNLPRIEVLSNAADSAQEVYLECIRVG